MGFSYLPCTIPLYHTSITAALRIKSLEAHYFHTDPIPLTAKYYNCFTKASENGLCALASFVFHCPERERDRERERQREGGRDRERNE